MTNIELVKLSIKAREKSYAPYSNFFVGAALLTTCGKVFTGCNIENAAYSPTLCAERSAFATAVSSGFTQFSAISIAGWAKDQKSGSATPCGVCRQFMKEFCKDDFLILVTNYNYKYEEYTLGELLPHGFGAESL